MLEILSDKSSNPQVQQKTEASTNQPSSMGVHSKLRNDVSISIPSINFNENCTAIRENLPIFHYRDEILRLVDRNQIVIVESTTGSGKSTQVKSEKFFYYILFNLHFVIVDSSIHPRRSKRQQTTMQNYRS